MPVARPQRRVKRRSEVHEGRAEQPQCTNGRLLGAAFAQATPPPLQVCLHLAVCASSTLQSAPTAALIVRIAGSAARKTSTKSGLVR